MPDLTITAKSSKATLAYRETLNLIVTVRNNLSTDVFMPSDRCYAWTTSASDLQVLIGQSELPNNYSPYDFIPPRLIPIPPGNTIVHNFTIGLPTRTPIIGPDGIYAEQERRQTGQITVFVRLGYLKQPFKPSTTAPLSDYVREQLITPAATFIVQMA
jgi:hypothetical protein